MVSETQITEQMLSSALDLYSGLKYHLQFRGLEDDPQVRRLRRLAERAEKRYDLLYNRWEQHLGPSAAQLGLRCPTQPRHKGDLVGCGSTDISGPDADGMYDCNNCGLFFLAEAAESVPVTDANPLMQSAA